MQFPIRRNQAQQKLRFAPQQHERNIVRKVFLKCASTGDLVHKYAMLSH